jgi:hypothetical protein
LNRVLRPAEINAICSVIAAASAIVPPTKHATAGEPAAAAPPRPRQELGDAVVARRGAHEDQIQAVRLLGTRLGRANRACELPHRSRQNLTFAGSGHARRRGSPCDAGSSRQRRVSRRSPGLRAVGLTHGMGRMPQRIGQRCGRAGPVSQDRRPRPCRR